MLWYFCRGEMAERLNAPVLKTDVLKGTGGSNPSFSAEKKLKTKVLSFFSLQCFFLFSKYLIKHSNF